MQRRLMCAIVIAGICLRIAQWLAGQPIWHDEWYLLHNVEQKNAHQLMGPLQKEQGAPPLFLLTLRGLYLLFGESRIAMRGPALLAGSLSLILFAMIAWKSIGSTPSLLIVAIMAFSDRMIWHSAEIKPYSVDVFFTCEILFCAIVPGPRWRLICLAKRAAVGMWASYATPFVFLGAMIALVPRKRSQWIGWLVAASVGAASFAAMYFLVARHQQTAGLASSWTDDFVPWKKPLWILPWLGRETLDLGNYASNGFGWIIVPLAIAGTIVLWRKRLWQEIVLFGGPIIVVLFAAAAHQYPFGGSRATLFLFPALLLLTGTAMAAWRNQAPQSLARLWWTPAAVVVVAMFGLAAYHVAVPRVRSAGIKALAQFIVQHRQTDDVIYVVGQDGPEEFLSYWQNRGGQIIPWPQGEPAPTVPPHIGRFWIVGTYNSPARFENWESQLIDPNHPARQLYKIQLRDGGAALFDATAPSIQK